MDIKEVREKIYFFCEDLQELTDDLKYELGFKKSGGWTKEIGKSAYSMAFELESKKMRFMDGSEHEKLNYVEKLEAATEELKDIIETLKDLWSDCYI